MNILEKRRRELGMARAVLAERSGVCPDCVDRILDFGIIEEIPQNVRAISHVLGFNVGRWNNRPKPERPKVGIAVVIYRGDRVLLGWRKGGHSPNTWGFPGGHLEYGESFAACAARETLEETGVNLSGFIKFGTVENVIYLDEKKHYVTVFMTTTMPRYQDVKIMEPKRCGEWRWFPWNELPENVMLGIKQLRPSFFKDCNVYEGVERDRETGA